MRHRSAAAIEHPLYSGRTAPITGAASEDAIVIRAPGLVLVALSVLVACAGGGAAPGPVTESPHDVDGEALRGPDAAAVATPAVEESDPSGVARLDWNGDQHVDREEFRNHFARSFHSLDADDDRLVRGDELGELPKAAVTQADRSGDGALDVDEYVSLTLVWFVACDRNADDVLGPDETRACSATRNAPE